MWNGLRHCDASWVLSKLREPLELKILARRSTRLLGKGLYKKEQTNLVGFQNQILVQDLWLVRPDSKHWRGLTMEFSRDPFRLFSATPWGQYGTIPSIYAGQAAAAGIAVSLGCESSMVFDNESEDCSIPGIPCNLSWYDMICHDLPRWI
jgi:hypothetical protein